MTTQEPTHPCPPRLRSYICHYGVYSDERTRTFLFRATSYGTALRKATDICSARAWTLYTVILQEDP